MFLLFLHSGWFYHKWMLNFVNGFLCIYLDNHMAFIFQFGNMVYYIVWLADIEESLHPWNKGHLIMMYDLFNVLSDSDNKIARILLRIFASLFISDIDLKFSFSVTSLSNPGYFWEWNRALCYYTHKVDLNRDCFVDHVSPNWISPDIPAHTHCSPVYLCLPQIYMVSKDSLVQATIILHLHQSSSFLKDLPSLSLFPFCHHDYQSDHFKI